MTRRAKEAASSRERVLHAIGLQMLLAIHARIEDPNRVPLDVEVSFVPSVDDVLRVRELQRQRREV